MHEETRKAKLCPTCHSITYPADYKTTCDACGKTLPEDLKDGNTQYQSLTVFPKYHDVNKASEKTFCSWEHVLIWIKEGKAFEFSFISLPYLTYEDMPLFLEAMRVIAKNHKPEAEK